MDMNLARLKSGDVLALLAVAAFLSFLFWVAAHYSYRPAPPNNLGFPTTLECSNTGWLEPVCTKKR
jgi:hypothetical protein